MLWAGGPTEFFVVVVLFVPLSVQVTPGIRQAVPRAALSHDDPLRGAHTVVRASAPPLACPVIVTYTATRPVIDPVLSSRRYFHNIK